MISTWRGVAIACAVAVLLGLAAALSGGPRVAEVVDRALVPGFVAEDVNALAWTRGEAGGGGGGSGSGSREALRVERDPASGTGWASVGQLPKTPADARAIEDALAALRGGRWHRRGPVSAVGSPVATLTVSRPGAPLVIAIGGPIAGSDQRWLAIGDRGYLVDGWLARALAPEPLAMRIRRPLAEVAGASELRLAWPADAGAGSGAAADATGPFTIAGAPRALVAPYPLLLDPRVAIALERALSELEIVELPRSPVTAGGEVVAAGGVTVRDAGPCPGSPGRRAIDSTTGAGCVDDAAWERVRSAIRALALPAAQLVERRLVPAELGKLTLIDGHSLDLAGRPRIGDRDADPGAIAALLGALATAGDPVPVPSGPPLGTLVAVDRAGRAIALELHASTAGGGIAVRRGEPIGLRVPAAAWARLTAPAASLRDLTPWREEPTTVTAVSLDATTYARGAVLGEWTRTGPGRDAPTAVEQLAAALAAPQVSPRARAAAVRHTLTLQIQPIGGAPVRHTIQLGAPDSAGCPAILDGAPATLPGEVCTLVHSIAP